MKILIVVLIFLSQLDLFAETCNYNKLITKLQGSLTSEAFANCRIEIVEDYIELKPNDTKQNLVLLFVEDFRLDSQVGVDIWESHSCSYEYDLYNNTYHYSDHRQFGEKNKKRFIKFQLDSNDKLKELEIGVIEVNRWNWEQRAICKNNFNEDRL
jgi:hypothetical protein